MTRGGRTSFKGTKAKKKAFKKKTYTYAVKYAVLQAHEQKWANAAIKEKFLPGESSSNVRSYLCKWKKQSDFIALMASSTTTSSETRHRELGHGTALSFRVEGELVRWINALRQDGVPVSSKMLQLQAIEYAEASGISPGAFTASYTWQGSFLRRHRLSFRAKNRAGQASPDVDNVIGRAFASEVREWMQQYGVTRVYNADQTAVFFEMLPKRTVAERGSRTVWIKCGTKEKQRATAMLLADSDGNKYEPFMVFKTEDSTIKEVQQENDEKRHGFGKRLWVEIKSIQDAYGAQVYGNPTAWWNSDITVAWMKYFFGDRSTASAPVLLLLDSFSGHWTEDVKTYAASVNVILKSVPPKLTWRCQPADVAWMKPLKDGLRGKWVDFLREQLACRRSPTDPFVMIPPSRGDVAEWLTEGWLRLSERTIVSGFSKCGFRDPLPRDSVEPSSEARQSIDATDVVLAMEGAGLVDLDLGEVEDSEDVVAIVEEAIV